MSDEENKEINDISDDAVYLSLGGRDRRLHIGMKGWRIINPELGGLEKILERAKDDPNSFLFEVIPRLIQIAIAGGEHEDVDLDDIMDWLDVYGFNDLKDKVTPAVMGAIMNSLPEAKEKKNPRKAKQ